MKPHLFGTDGIRGQAFVPPLDRTTVSRLGQALAEHMAERGLPLRILLAGDTRASTEALASWFGGAFQAAGGVVSWAGVLPTPAVSHLVRSDCGFGAGVIVSASHNPARDNGIKLVGAAGTKWPEPEEHALEERLSRIPQEVPVAELPAPETSWAGRYLDLVAATVPAGALEGLAVVVDAAHGAGFRLAEALLARLGARVRSICAAPDGRNINDGCGALHPQVLARAVVEQGADAGVALDGDADRAILVTPTGRVLDGDHVLLLWGEALAEAGQLPGRRVVATVMSNFGLERALAERGIELLRCPVGDREVWHAMTTSGAALGGEQSGHVICAHYAVTGDGILTAAHVLAVLRRRGVSLDQAPSLPRFPQVLVNVPVSRRRPLTEVPELAAAVAEAERSLDGNGRVLVRYSGTEPLLRIMVEAPQEGQATAVAERLAELARHHCGSPGQRSAGELAGEE